VLVLNVCPSEHLAVEALVTQSSAHIPEDNDADPNLG
jgi:hypothetical protein